MEKVENIIEMFLRKESGIFSQLPNKFYFGHQELEFFQNLDSFLKEQVGFSVDENNQKLDGWNSNWIVIGTDNLVGDPIFVDTSVEYNPVYTAIHGQGIWTPELIATSPAAFVHSVQVLEKISKGRTNPKQLESNPISDEERKKVIEEIASVNKLESYAFWESFLSA
jgi:hypothetical protein